MFLGFNSGTIANRPNPGDKWTNPDGYFYCADGTSQLSADLCAAAGAADNGVDGGGPGGDGVAADAGNRDPGTLYRSSEQGCVIQCPDGGSFTYTLAAGKVTDLNPTLVDRIANSIACKQAQKYLICIGPLDNVTGTVGTGYFGTVKLTGSFAPYKWTAVTPLPTGLILDDASGGDATLSKTVGIIGTPTASGAQSFTLRATDTAGNFADRSFTITVDGVTCAAIIAALSWTVFTNGPVTIAAAGALITYSSVADPFGSNFDADATITNTTPSPINVKFTQVWSGDGGSIVAPVDAYSRLFIDGVQKADDSYPNGPFSGGWNFTATIPPGGSIAVELNVNTSQDGFFTGHCTLACV